MQGDVRTSTHAWTHTHQGTSGHVNTRGHRAMSVQCRHTPWHILRCVHAHAQYVHVYQGMHVLRHMYTHTRTHILANAEILTHTETHPRRHPRRHLAWAQAWLRTMNPREERSRAEAAFPQAARRSLLGGAWV